MTAPYTLTTGADLCSELHVFERRPMYQRVFVTEGVVIGWPGAKVKDPRPLGFRLEDGSPVSRELVDGLTRSTASSNDLEILDNPRADGGEAEIAFTVLGNTSEAMRRKLPNAILGVIRNDSGWLVGCRDGCLYSFTRTGSLRWTWTTPGTSLEIPAYQRPQPYHLLGHEDGALVASWSQVWLVDNSGHTRWNLDLSKELPSTTISVGRRELVDVETGRSAVVDEGVDVGFSISPSIVSGLDVIGEHFLVLTSDGHALGLGRTGRLAFSRKIGQVGAHAIRQMATGEVVAVGAQPNLWLLGDAAPVQLPDAYQWPANLSAVGKHFFSYRHGFPHFGMMDRHGRLVLQVQAEETISSLSTFGDILAFVTDGKLVVLRVDGMEA